MPTNEKKWDQPIIKGKKMAFAGYLIKEFNKLIIIYAGITKTWFKKVHYLVC